MEVVWLDPGSFRMRGYNGRVVADLPAFLAVETDREASVLTAIGEDAAQMRGRAPSGFEISAPFWRGTIQDFDRAVLFLRTFLDGRVFRSGNPARTRPLPVSYKRVVCAVPPGLTTVQEHALEETLRSAGARDILLAPAPVLAALGAGLEVESPRGVLVTDVGHAESRIALVSMGDVVAEVHGLPGGSRFTRALADYLLRQKHLEAGEPSLEALKESLAAGKGDLRISGMSHPEALPSTQTVEREAILETTEPLCKEIAAGIGLALEKAQPELVADITSSGVLLTGGGSRFPGVEEAIHRVLDLPVVRPETPDLAVAQGLVEASRRIRFHRGRLPERLPMSTPAVRPTAAPPRTPSPSP